MVAIKETKPAAYSGRPYFQPRQELTAEQLNREQAYHIKALQHAMHGLAGYGVVYGYSVASRKSCKECEREIDMGCGLAFDRHGRTLSWKGGTICVSDLAGAKPRCEGRYTLLVHYAERRPVRDESHLCHSPCQEGGWIDETVVFSLIQGCEPVEHCHPDEDRCEDLDEYVCRRLANESCLEQSEALCPADFRDLWYAADDGIPLACIYLCQLGERCEPRYGFAIEKTEVCGFRPPVYRNPLLFDLIRGRHEQLARIERLSFGDWSSREWGQPVAWDEFEARFKPDHPEGIAVRFTKPVRIKTLHPASIFLTAITREQESYFHDALRIPTIRREPLDVEGEYARGVRLHFPERWLQSQLAPDLSRFTHGAIIEFTVRCSLLRDNCHRVLDGRPLDIQDRNLSRAMPGADFMAAFAVADLPLSAQQGGPEESAARNSLRQFI